MDALTRIRRLMEERHWTEYRLAKESGLSQSTIANIFKRNNVPTLSTLESICSAFGISLAQFFSEGEDPVPLTEEQRELLTKWATLSAEQKETLLTLIDMIQK